MPHHQIDVASGAVAFDANFPGGDGRSVTVMYPDPDGGWETWADYKSRTQPPCGG